MYSKWTSHLDSEDEKQDFRLYVISSKDVLARQKQILDEEELALDRSEISVEQFDSPNWGERQAYKNGYRAALFHLKKLIDLDQQETNFNERLTTT